MRNIAQHGVMAPHARCAMDWSGKVRHAGSDLEEEAGRSRHSILARGTDSDIPIPRHQEPGFFI